MIKRILERWLGLDPIRCETCEFLRIQLDKSEGERRELLHRILDKDKSEPPSIEEKELKPIQPRFVPWTVRRELLEAEDRKKAELMRNKELEMKYGNKVEPKVEPRIAELEKELGVATEK